MNYRWLILLALGAAASLQPAGVGTPALALQAPEAAEEEVVAEEPPPPLAIPPGYRYEAGGRRDPFVNPIPPPVDAGPVIPAERPLGLPGVLLNEAQLIGVVTSQEPSMTVVIVSAPGNRIFFARVGDELFDVVISRITSDAIYFQVKPLPGSLGGDRGEQVVRRLGAAPGE
jgi:hypothetical protein